MKRRTLLATAALGLGLIARPAPPWRRTRSRPASSMSARSATAAGPTSTTRARWRCRKTFGDKVEIVCQENVPEGADAERVLTQMALSGCNIIFTTSFGYMDATNAVAAKFPDVKFEHATGYKREHRERLDLQRPLLRRPRGHGHHRGQDDQVEQDRLHRLLPDPRGHHGHQLGYYLHAKKVNPDVEHERDLGLHLVRPGERGRCRQGDDRAGRGRDRAAHRLDRAAGRDGQDAGRHRLRSGHPTWPNTSPRRASRRSSTTGRPITSSASGALLDGTYAQADAWEGIAGGEVEIGEITERCRPT